MSGCSGTARLRRRKENQKAKVKRQKSKISAPGRGPDWKRMFAYCPQSKQSSMTQSAMTQFSTGAGNWPPRGIFAARKKEQSLGWIQIDSLPDLRPSKAALRLKRHPGSLR